MQEGFSLLVFANEKIFLFICFQNQMAELKSAQTQNSSQLRSLLLDPAVNLVFQRMTKEMEDYKEKLKQSQNELSAWKFTADRCISQCNLVTLYSSIT